MPKTVLTISAARRDKIKQLLPTQPQFELVGELTSTTSLHLVAQLAPDIVIVDCAAPQVNPLVVLPQLQMLTSTSQIIALGVNNNTEERALLRTLGAAGYAILEQAGSFTEALFTLGADIRLSALPSVPRLIRSTAEFAQHPRL